MGRILSSLQAASDWKNNLRELERYGTDFPSVLTNGCFDLITVAHVRLFAFCNRPIRTSYPRLHRLFVAIDSDDRVKWLKGKDRPIVPLEQRMEIVAAFDGVSCVFPFDCPVEEVIKMFQPDVYVKGGDWEEKAPGIEYAKTVVYFPIQEGISTSNIVWKIKGQPIFSTEKGV